ncbi:MAG: dTDP-4-dehydrorhamnose reductase [Erythrobacter sp.]
MKVLVTGAAGQLGTALLASAPDDWDVTGLTRADLDLSDGGAIAALVEREKPDWVINASAYTAVDKAESEPDLAMAVNGAAPAAFAKALNKTGGRLLQVSTDFVFDGSANTPYTPDANRNPLSVYGQTKAAGEDGSSLSSDAVILRTSWVYSAGFANFVATMLRLMSERDELRVVSDQIGSPSWAPDIARSIWGLIAAGEAGTYHHSDAGAISWHGFATAIAEEALELGLIGRMPTVHEIPTSEFPTPATRPAYSVLDDASLRAVIGGEAAPWRENLRAMLAEVKALG